LSAQREVSAYTQGCLKRLLIMKNDRC